MITKPALMALALSALLSAQSAKAADALLQVVDLSDRGMSSEGGEAKLFRLTGSRLGRCKIEAVHYGEIGRTTYRFIFDSGLRYAALREYAYAEPIAITPNLRVNLKREVLLASAEGAGLLPREFSEYRSFFSPQKLARCSSVRRSS